MRLNVQVVQVKNKLLWVKTSKEYYPVLIAKDGWCN